MPLLAPLEKIIPVSFLLTVVLSSCTHRPLSECRSLITMLNQGDKLLTNIDLSDGQGISQTGKNLKLLREKLDQLTVQDQKLQEFRSQFSQIYQTLGDALVQTNEAIALANKSTTEVTLSQIKQTQITVTQARLSISQASQAAASISQGLNDYCQVSTKRNRH